MNFGINAKTTVMIKKVTMCEALNYMPLGDGNEFGLKTEPYLVLCCFSQVTTRGGGLCYFGWRK